jgi:hypothetical protein
MLKFFTPQLVTRNSQPSPPGSKKLAVDLGFLFLLILKGKYIIIVV